MKKSTDIYFASALLALGANLVHVNRTDPRHMEFEFEGRIATLFQSDNIPAVPVELPDLDKVETDWANGSLMVNATAYADALKRMKSVVHSRD